MDYTTFQTLFIGILIFAIVFATLEVKPDHESKLVKYVAKTLISIAICIGLAIAVAAVKLIIYGLHQLIF